MNESNESSVLQSSHDGTGSYSNVTSVHRSESTGRSRQLGDADPNSRSSGVHGSPKARTARSSSSQRTDKKTLVRKPEKPRGPGGSPAGRTKRSTADEELDTLIEQMKVKDTLMQEQVVQLEDERRAELALYDSKMRRAQLECQEFDQEYNRVLDCWRRAEERSRTFEIELRSEINLFYEVRGYLGEMQQQMGQVSQQDYGAGLRIKELERIITLEREETKV